MVLSDKVKAYPVIRDNYQENDEAAYGEGRGVERKRSVIEVSKITFTVVKSRGQRP